MLNFIIITVSLILGIVLRKSGKLPDATPQILNRYVIWVALPAAILATVPQIQLSSELLLPASMPWVVFIIGLLIFLAASKLLATDKHTLGALILTGSLGNTSFVGFPMLTALLGESSLKTAIIIDQAGSFLVVSTLGLITASVLSHHATSFKEILKRIATFPPFIVLIAALLTRSLVYPEWMVSFLKMLAFTLGPVALVAVGYQLRFKRALLLKKRRALCAGLAYKLLIAPALIALIYSGTSLGHEEWLVTVLESAMPPMITAAIIASEYGLDEELTSLMVGIGIPLSLITVPIWYLVLR